jgi:uncharacterized protein YbjT (DUF2867 family)
MDPRTVFITGGTGYIGRRLIAQLVTRGHEVRALVRPASRDRVPANATVVLGNALDRSSFMGQIAPADTFVQLVGTPRPSPAKAQQFRMIDFVSVRESVAAARAAGVRHFVYVSVARPAPTMKAYIDVRKQGEAFVRESGLNATILRPWYVLGPGHRWPYLLLPMYWLFERLPSTRDTARRLGLVTLPQMIAALWHAVESPPNGVRIVTVPEIRRAERTGE